MALELFAMVEVVVKVDMVDIEWKLASFEMRAQIERYCVKKPNAEDLGREDMEDEEKRLCGIFGRLHTPS